MKAGSISFHLAAFLLPLGIRLFPELFANPYPIGFDTVAYYVPVITSRIALMANPLDYLGGSILLYLHLTYAYLLLGSTLFVMKVAPALLLGILGWSAYLLGRKLLAWGRSWALVFALLSSLYFVTLRLSWDLHRNVLGLSFVLLTLACMKLDRADVRYGAVAIFASLAVMTHEASAVLVVIVSVVQLVNGRLRRSREFVPFLPAWLLIALQFFSGRNWASQIQTPSPVPDLAYAIAYNFGFVLFSFSLILPLAVCGLKLGLDRRLAAWALVASFFGLVPSFGLPTGAEYRWVLILTIPLMVLFVQGIQVLHSLKLISARRIGRVAIALSLVAIIVVSSGYLGLHDLARSYLRSGSQYLPLMPASMLESTVPVGDIPSIIEIAKWAHARLPTTAILVLPFQIYGWYIATISEQEAIELRPVNTAKNLDEIIPNIKPKTGPEMFYARAVDIYRPRSIPVLVGMALQLGAAGRDVYVVWWAARSSIEEQGRLPASFSVEFVSGKFAVFLLTRQTP